MNSTDLKRKITTLLEGDVIQAPWARREPVVQTADPEVTGAHQLSAKPALGAILAKLKEPTLVPMGQIVEQMKLITNNRERLEVLKALFRNHFHIFSPNMKKTWASIEQNIDEAVDNMGLDPAWLEFTRGAAKAAYAKRE